MNAARKSADVKLVILVVILVILAFINSNQDKRLEDLEKVVALQEDELNAKHTQLGSLTREHKNHLRLHWLDDIAEGKR